MMIQRETSKIASIDINELHKVIKSVNTMVKDALITLDFEIMNRVFKYFKQGVRGYNSKGLEPTNIQLTMYQEQVMSVLKQYYKAEPVYDDINQLFEYVSIILALLDTQKEQLVQILLCFQQKQTEIDVREYVLISLLFTLELIQHVPISIECYYNNQDDQADQYDQNEQSDQDDYDDYDDQDDSGDQDEYDEYDYYMI